MAVTDILRVMRSFRQAVASLRVYRDFIPDPCLPDSELAIPEVEAPGQIGEQPQVCLVFTDIQSSTALWEAFPYEMREGLRQHNNTLREVAEECGGYEVKTIGDAFMFALKSPIDGLRLAMTAQARLVERSWPDKLCDHPMCRKVAGADPKTPLWNGPRIRIGVNWGPVTAEQNPVTGRWDYFGGTVNVAARVEAALVHGGLVGCTDAVINAVGEEGLRELGSPVVTDWGRKELKGISHPVQLHVVLPHALSRRAVDLKGLKNPLKFAAPTEDGVGSASGNSELAAGVMTPPVPLIL
eukprot:Hpha_TRINITY_DN16130_c0_g8::TRINITY_DN16130_c0_g8_i1::g.5775::m.5775